MYVCMYVCMCVGWLVCMYVDRLVCMYVYVRLVGMIVSIAMYVG